jgi:hypothetical protein
MAKSLIQKVQEALEDACKSDLQADIKLEPVQPDKVAGMVISKSFAGQTPSERQAQIWRYLDAQLSPYERTRVVFIVADTPEEHAALQESRHAS